MNYDYSFNGIDLVRTCGGCPESYDAYKDGLYVGYMHLRHGHFTVNTEDYTWLAHPEGDGIFEADEREYYLNKACKVLDVCSSN